MLIMIITDIGTHDRLLCKKKKKKDGEGGNQSF